MPKIFTKITNVTDPSAAQDAATKVYVDRRTLVFVISITTTSGLTVGGLYYADAAAGSFTATLPANALAGGVVIVRKNTWANVVTVAPTTGEAIDGVTNGTTAVYGMGDHAMFISTGAQNWAQVLDQSAAVATASLTVRRDTAGRAQVVDPSVAADIATKNYVDTPRLNTITSSATPAINTDTTDIFTITALGTAITSMTSGLTGTPNAGQRLLIRIKDNGTSRTILWGASFASSGVAPVLSPTVINKTHLSLFIYDDVLAKWVCMATDASGY